MKYSFLSLIIGLILIGGAFLLVQKGNVSPFEVPKLQEYINTNQIGENDYEEFDKAIDDLIKSGQIEKYLNTSSIVIFLITVSLGLSLFFFGVHTIIDKLFFKKFFEKPNFKVAVRRSVILTATVIGIMVLRFYRLEWNSVVLIFPFVLIVELTIIYFSSSSKVEEIDIKEAQIDSESDELLTKIEEEIAGSFEGEETEEPISENEVLSENFENDIKLEEEIEDMAENVEEHNLEKEILEKKESELEFAQEPSESEKEKEIENEVS